MFLGHLAVGLACKRAAPSVSLGTWIASVLFIDLLWPLFLLAGLEHVRIAPGITAFTPLDFYDYPITHSLVGCAGWAGVFAASWMAVRRSPRIAGLLALGVVSHWVLDVISHRADVPILPAGPFVGLGLWNSVGATLAVELFMFGTGVAFYVRSKHGMVRPSFWVFTAFLLIVYVAAAFGPPPPDARTLAWSALAVWLLVPAAWWVDRGGGRPARQQRVDQV